MSTAAKKHGPASRDRQVTRVATPPKLKRAKAAGKQKASTQTAIEAKPPADQNTANNTSASLSVFDQTLSAARDLLLGPPDGELGNAGELESEAFQCELSTGKAIGAAQPTEKLGAFYSGFAELRDKLCASATRYYNTCFEHTLSNRTELKTDNPAEYARGFPSATSAILDSSAPICDLRHGVQWRR